MVPEAREASTEAKVLEEAVALGLFMKVTTGACVGNSFHLRLRYADLARSALRSEGSK